jgi:hypothetical protein
MNCFSGRIGNQMKVKPRHGKERRAARMIPRTLCIRCRSKGKRGAVLTRLISCSPFLGYPPQVMRPFGAEFRLGTRCRENSEPCPGCPRFPPSSQRPGSSQTNVVITFSTQ